MQIIQLNTQVVKSIKKIFALKGSKKILPQLWIDQSRLILYLTMVKKINATYNKINVGMA